MLKNGNLHIGKIIGRWLITMKKLTIAEHREREIRLATEKYNIPYNELKHLMNRFYRLNADMDRLSYL